MLEFRALHGEKARLIAERNYFKVKCNGRKTKANERKKMDRTSRQQAIFEKHALIFSKLV